MRQLVGVVCMVAAVAGCPGSDRRTRGDAGAGSDSGVVRECGEAGASMDARDCNCDTDCRTGALCIPEDRAVSPRGFCGRSCTSDADCMDGTVCSEVAGSEDVGLCTLPCEAHTDCPAGDVCFDRECYGYCRSDADCLSGRCHATSRRCLWGEEPAGAGVYGACVRDEDCQSGSCNANNGRCTTLCLISAQDCPDGAVCVGGFFDTGDVGYCVPPCVDGGCADPELECRDLGIPEGRTGCMKPWPDAACKGRPAGNTDGLPCGCHDDCMEGTLCQSEERTGLPGGICSRPCDTTSDCPDEGTICLGGVYCARSCFAESDCGPGRICWSNACYPFCTSDAECEVSTCDPYYAQCQPSPDAGLAMGAVCTADSQCKSGICLTADGDEGYCGALCRVSAQSCPDGAVCVGDGTDDVGTCYPLCTSPADCTAEGRESCVGTTFPSDAPNHCE